MFSFLYFLGAILVVALTAAVTVWRDERVSKYKLSQMGLKSYVTHDHHWHTFGHFFLDFFITVMILVWFLMCALALLSYTPQIALMIFKHPVAFSFLCMAPSVILVLYQELIVDGHLAGFFGKQEHDTFDFFFDLFTHFAGGATASLMLSGLLTAWI